MTISDRIRKQLEQPDGLTQEALQPLVELYDQEARQVNSRLGDCVALLRKGLRSEAIQQAFMKPNVLDWAAKLDFPELEDWIEILQFYGINVPAVVDRNAAQQLHEALVDAQPLDELLRQHRRLAIAKAPLSWRLKVLRRLTELDPLNTVWKEDQEQWETVRLKQIPGELKAAANNEQQLSALLSELEYSKWLVVPPGSLVKQVKANTIATRDESLIATLSEISQRLHAAYSEGNESAAKDLAISWNSSLKQLNCAIPESLDQDTAPALEWLLSLESQAKLQESHDRSVEMLETLLQSTKSTIPELQQAYYKLASLQLECPPLLLKQYHTKIHELQAGSFRRMVWTAASIVALLVIVLASVGLWYRQSMFQKSVATAEQRLLASVEEGKLDQAEQYLQSLKQQTPGLAASAEIVAVESMLNTKKEEEKIRRSLSLAAIDLAQAEDDEDLDIDRIMIAEKQAVLPDEKAQVVALRNRWEQREREIATQQFNVVKSSLNRIDSELTRMQSLSFSQVTEQEIEQLINECQVVTLNNPRSGPQASSLAKLTAQKGTNLLESIRKQKRQSASRSNLTSGMKSARSIVELQEQMRKYTLELADDPLTPELQKRLDEAVLWTHMQDWSRWCTDLATAANNKSLTDNFLVESASRLVELKERLSPLAIDRVQEHLSVTAEVLQKRSKVYGDLEEDMKNSVMNEIATLVYSFGNMEERLFINLQTKEEFASELGKGRFKKGARIPVLSNRLGAISNHEFKTEAEVKVLEEPISTMTKLREKLSANRKVATDNWDIEMKRLIEMVASAESLDRQIKANLIYALLNAGVEGSVTFEMAYSDALGNLNSDAASRALWFSKQDFATGFERDFREVLSAANKRWSGARESRDQSIALLSKEKFVWVGSLLPSASGALEANTYRADIPNGDLFVVVPNNSTPDVGEILPVGRVIDKKVELRPNSRALQVGRPLFWKSSRTK